MAPDDIKAGEWYLARAGNWIYDVESVEEGHVLYTVLQDGRKCDDRVASFARRVERVAGSPTPES